jgi:hypothetical protein
MKMKRSAVLACLGLVLATAPVSAQGPGGHRAGGPPEHGPMLNAADFLLGQTGALKLSDQQVTRLAAISRRAAERHQALMAGMQAAHSQAGARQQAPGAAEQERMHQAMRQAHEQMSGDLRDALAVLTPEQHAQAWEMAARHHAMGGGPGQGQHGGPGQHGPGHGAPGHGGPGGPPPQGAPGGHQDDANVEAHLQS